MIGTGMQVLMVMLGRVVLVVAPERVVLATSLVMFLVISLVVEVVAAEEGLVVIEVLIFGIL